MNTPVKCQFTHYLRISRNPFSTFATFKAVSELSQKGVAMKKTVLAAIALASSLLAMQSAQAVGRMMDVSVVERHTGRVLPAHYHRGEYWVAGTPGAAYSVRVRNNTGERLLAVMSVDGVNVLSGETAATGQSGYVFDPWRVSDISGWRKNTQEIAAFEFTASPHSYAERTGRPFDVGVIGVALFRERLQYTPPPVMRPQPWPYPSHPYEKQQDGSSYKRYEGDGSSSREAAPAAGPTAKAQGVNPPSAEAHADSSTQAQRAPRYGERAEPKLGTGHGQREYAPITHTGFERAQSSPNEVIRIRYDSHANLVGMGVIREPRPRYHQERRPDPFPQSPQHYGYVPDPPPYWR
jgi:hypothetical protein